MRVLLAIGGSTNGIVHLTAIAGRLGLEIDLKRTRPHGPRDAGAAGPEALGPALHGRLPRGRRHGHAVARIEAAAAPGRADGHRPHARRGDRRAGPAFAQDVVRPLANPIYPQGGIAVLRGNLAPGGAIIKQSAADPALMEHEGRAVVFENVERPGRAHRQRRPRRDGRRRPGAEEHRPQGRARHARGRLPADPAQAGARGREGHGAHLRRPHERHRVRHHRAARDARSRRSAGRWPTCAAATASA